MENTCHKMVEVYASGKVLITGGYLIIDPANQGLVIATSNKFCCKIEPNLHSTSVIV